MNWSVKSIKLSTRDSLLTLKVRDWQGRQRHPLDVQHQCPNRLCGGSVVWAIPDGGLEIPGSKAKRIELEYWEARRALRLCPILAGDPIKAVNTFIKEHLRLDEDFLDCLGPISVRRVPAGPAAKMKGEVIVAFQSVEVRDAVRAAARNLAGKSSDFGVRLEIPNRLKSSMKSLQSMAYEIRQKFPQSRTNVLFDDDALELVLDF